jgi:hypothetical protein
MILFRGKEKLARPTALIPKLGSRRITATPLNYEKIFN